MADPGLSMQALKRYVNSCWRRLRRRLRRFNLRVSDAKSEPRLKRDYDRWSAAYDILCRAKRLPLVEGKLDLSRHANRIQYRALRDTEAALNSLKRERASDRQNHFDELKTLEDENRRLKAELASSQLEVRKLKDVTSKSGAGRAGTLSISALDYVELENYFKYFERLRLTYNLIMKKLVQLDPSFMRPMREFDEWTKPIDQAISAYKQIIRLNSDLRKVETPTEPELFRRQKAKPSGKSKGKKKKRSKKKKVSSTSGDCKDDPYICKTVTVCRLHPAPTLPPHLWGGAVYRSRTCVGTDATPMLHWMWCCQTAWKAVRECGVSDSVWSFLGSVPKPIDDHREYLVHDLRGGSIPYRPSLGVPKEELLSRHGLAMSVAKVTLGDLDLEWIVADSVGFHSCSGFTRWPLVTSCPSSLGNRIEYDYQSIALFDQLD